ncbi:MAG TPA: FAD:protein FMN transferase [bacterium]|nr:FAD:protein FMN transferase [bacterium]
MSEQGPTRGASERGLTRRRLLVGGLAGGALLLTGGSTALVGRARWPVLQGARQVMGTWAHIVLSHPQPQAQQAMEAAFAALEDVQRRMTRFSPDSEIGRVNATAGRMLPVSALTAEVVSTAVALARASDGRFDPGLGMPEAAWGFYDHRAPRHLPGGWARPAPAWRALRLERRDGVPHLGVADPSVQVDLGGIAKGYGVDRAIEVLRAAGVEHALVEAGGDLRALGPRPDGTPWRIGVRHPRRPGQVLAVLPLRDGAVATSGDYENFFVRDGERYAHLLDARSGRPARFHQSVSVIGPTAMLTDALATAACAAPPAEAQALLRRTAPGGWLAVDEVGRMVRG